MSVVFEIDLILSVLGLSLRSVIKLSMRLIRGILNPFSGIGMISGLLIIGILGSPFSCFGNRT